jgi:tetratricopeptide (TPR) repeat protein
VLNSLALVYDAEGKRAAAEPMYRRALKIWEATQGPNSPSVAAALNNLAGLLAAEGRYKEAAPIYDRSLNVVQKAYGPSDLHLALALEGYAAFLRKTKRTEEAQRMIEAAQAIRKAHSRQSSSPAASGPR